MAWFGGMFRYFRAAGVARRGRGLLARGEHQQAKVVLEQALALLGRDEPAGASVGVWYSERLVALRDLSYAAAKAGDVASAREAIAEGLAHWEKGGLPGNPKYKAIDEWRAWARAYLASTDKATGSGA